jgi:hypothetical protein
MASFGALTMLVIPFMLGTAYNLDGTVPASGKSVGMFSSPLLAIHVILGILLVSAAIMLVVRAIQAQHTPSIARTTAGPAGSHRRVRHRLHLFRTAATARRSPCHCWPPSPCFATQRTW